MVFNRLFWFFRYCGKISAIQLFRLMAEKAFLDDDKTEYAESLRRCLKALNNALNNETYNRFTVEFDNLITVRS